MIEINGKVYRNIQEQVGENQENIEDLDTRVTALENTPSQTYTEGAGIDITNDTISVDATVVPFKIDLATVATTGNYNDLSNKPNIPDMTDYVPKSIDSENTEYGINYGLSNNTPQLVGADTSGSHPCDARVRVTYDSVRINANDYNHGVNADTYTGSIDVTGSYVDIKATDGEDTTTLRVSPSEVTVNGSPIGGGSSIDEVILDYSTTLPTKLPEELELTQAQYNLIKQHIESRDFNIRLIIVTYAGINTPEYTILYPNDFTVVGGVMSPVSGFFGKHYSNYSSCKGGNMEFWGTFSIYYDSTTKKYLIGLHKFKVAYTV